jgi:hypothetical protein
MLLSIQVILIILCLCKNNIDSYYNDDNKFKILHNIFYYYLNNFQDIDPIIQIY